MTGWRDYPTRAYNRGFLAFSEYFRDGKPVYVAGKNPALNPPAVCSSFAPTRREAEAKVARDKRACERIYGIRT